LRFESNGFAAKACAALTGIHAFFQTASLLSLLTTTVFNRTKRLVLWVKLVVLEARLRPVEHLDMDVEIGCRSSWMCE
jgi:hypothetical protein